MKNLLILFFAVTAAFSLGACPDESHMETESDHMEQQQSDDMQDPMQDNHMDQQHEGGEPAY